MKTSRAKTVWTIWLAPCCLLLGMTCCLTQSVAAQSDKPETEKKEPVKKQDAEQKTPAQDKADKKDSAEKVLAIVGADIYTVSREVVRRGVVLIKDGKIEAVGQGLEVPKEATLIDAKGKYVTPGFVAVDAMRLAMRVSSRSKVADTVDPFDEDMKLALGVGITTVCVANSSGGGISFFAPREAFLGLDPDETEGEALLEYNPDFGNPDASTCQCCGLPILPSEPITRSSSSTVTPRKYAVLKLSYGDLEPMLMSETPFFSVSSRTLTGALNLHKWRQSIEKTRKYLADVEAHQQAIKDGKKDRPPRKTVSDDLIRLVQKESYLRTDADSAEEIRAMVDLAQELDYKLMLDNVAEGWLSTEALNEGGVAVAFAPRRRRRAERAREDASGTSIEMSGILERAGVPFAMKTLSPVISLNGLAGRDLTSLPLEAAFAVRGGCSESAALASLTIVPARMLGLADRIGSIEKGKDADLLILDGTPLDYRTYVDQAIVAGKVRYDRAKDRVYPVFDRDKL